MSDEQLDRLPTIPDKVVDKLQSGKDVAIEELVSESAVQAQQEAATRKAEPVHASALKPISKAEAARRTTFDGKTLPRLPATRRVIPEPFRRPTINLSLPWEPKKIWQYVRADQVQEGDIVPDIGVVQSVTSQVRHESLATPVRGWTDVAVGADVMIAGPERYTTVDATTQVRVFRMEGTSHEDQPGQDSESGHDTSRGLHGDPA